MPVAICPRCKHVNPEYASYCFYDGSALHAHQAAVVHHLPSEFVFPTGRRCKTFDDLAQACQEEWTAARDLLMRGVFAQFFKACGRADLVRAAADARAQPSPDIALTTFLGALPGVRTQSPKLDLHPRRILLGALLVGEAKTVPLTITNQAAGLLQGTVSVTEGQDWLSLSDGKPVHELEVNTVREQVVKLTINTKGIAAGQTYGAKLTVVTNGGVVEVPLRMDLAAQPFAKPPFHGARTQRELAEKMRSHPKQAVPVLESGEVQRWYGLNGWTYPVQGTPIKGVGGVQQFFEGIGVSKPPPLDVTPKELRLTCPANDTQRAQVVLQTPAKKWVYASIRSDRPWLKPVQAQVAGPQRAGIAVEVDTHQWRDGSSAQGALTVEANGGQKLIVKVNVEVSGAAAAVPRGKPATEAFDFSSLTTTPPAIPAAEPAPAVAYDSNRVTPESHDRRRMPGFRWLPALLTVALACVGLRLLMVPLLDFGGRHAIAAAAASKLGIEPTADSTFEHAGGWLQLPWMSILGESHGSFSASIFNPSATTQVSTPEFGHYFVTYFIRWFVLATFWMGAIVGALAVLRRGGTSADLPWGIVAGAGAGLAAAATLAALVLCGEFLTLAFWHHTIGPHAGAGYLMLWCLFALMCWLGLGVVLGSVLPWFGWIRRGLIEPMQTLLAALCRAIRLNGLAAFWQP